MGIKTQYICDRCTKDTIAGDLYKLTVQVEGGRPMSGRYNLGALYVCNDCRSKLNLELHPSKEPIEQETYSAALERLIREIVREEVSQ